MEAAFGGGGFRPAMHDWAHHERVCDGSAIRQMRRASSDIVCENASLNEKFSQVGADLAICPCACGDDSGAVNWNGVWLGTIQWLLVAL